MVRTRWMTQMVLVMVVLWIGCGDPEPDWQLTEVTDQGEVCLFSSADQLSDFAQDEGPQEYQVDEPVYLQYRSHECLSSSCDQNPSVSCTIERSDTNLAVTSSASWEHDVAADACTSDCGLMTATCTSAPLPEGTYTVSFGGQTTELAIPSTTDEPVCVSTPR